MLPISNCDKSEFINFCTTPGFTDFIQARKYSFQDVYDFGYTSVTSYSILQYLRKHEHDWYHFLNVGITYYDMSLVKYAVGKIKDIRKDVLETILEISEDDPKIYNYFLKML